MNRINNIALDHQPKDGLTISIKSNLSKVMYFSLGKETDISPERYDHPFIYLGIDGEGTFIVDDSEYIVHKNEGIFVNSGSLCGVRSSKGFVYGEISLGKDIKINKIVKSGEVFNLVNLLDYEKDSIVNVDIASNDKMKYVLMAFDEGTGLTPHRAPGDALVFALEGKAIIGYEGEDYEIEAGQTFKFDKNGLHSVTAKGKFKMALLIVKE